MNKAELIAAMAAKTGETKKAAEASVNAFVEVVTDSLKKGDKVQLVGFGSFEVRKRAARKGRNPQTKEEIKIPASKAQYMISYEEARNSFFFVFIKEFTIMLSKLFIYNLNYDIYKY